MVHDGDGFETRRRAGETRARRRNLADLGRTLEGPGSRERLETIQARFRALRPGVPWKGGLALLFLLTFAGTVAVGLVVAALSGG